MFLLHLKMISKKIWRAADLVFYDIETLRDIPLDNKYLEVAPEVVIWILRIQKKYDD